MTADWARPEWLAALVLVPLAALAVAWGVRRYRRALEAFSEEEVRERTQPLGSTRQALRGGLLVAALAALVLAVAGPRFGIERVETPPVGQRVVFALDVSLSMLAEDADPNRLERAKFAVRQILAGLPGVEAGLVVFAGEPSLAVPLTRDLEAVELYLETVGPEWISDPSTDIGEAVTAALDAFAEGPGPGRAIVLLSDGETHAAEYAAAAEAARERDVRIVALGVGTREGTRIPFGPGGWLMEDGVPVVTRLVPEPLETMARMTDGAYGEVDDGGVATAIRRVRSLDAAEESAGSRQRRADRYRWPLFLAVLCLALETVLRFRGRRELEPVAAVAAAILVVAMGRAPSPHELYEEGRYREALVAWRQADRSPGAGPREAHNRGNAAYRLGEFREAAASWAVAARTARTAERSAAAWYNAGNARYRIAQPVDAEEGTEAALRYWDSAVAAYREALLRTPDDADAKHNLELALRHRDRAGGGGGGGGGGGEDGAEGGAAGGIQPPSRPSGPAVGQMSRSEAERLLDALAARERQALQSDEGERRGAPPKGPGW